MASEDCIFKSVKEKNGQQCWKIMEVIPERCWKKQKKRNSEEEV